VVEFPLIVVLPLFFKGETEGVVLKINLPSPALTVIREGVDFTKFDALLFKPIVLNTKLLKN
jgi:hypothetical protein